jgi:hypothetical protein
MKILAGTGKGIYVVANGEAHRVLESRGVRDLSTIDGRIFAGTGSGLYVSDDSGQTWACTGLVDYEVWQVRGARNGVVYAATQPAALFKSTDLGDTWREVETFANDPRASQWCVPIKPPLPGRARALVVDRNNPDRLWVGVEVGGIMRSTDGGDSWKFDLPGENPDLHMMFAQPDNPNVLYASTGYGRLDGVAPMCEGNAGVFRSDDGGINWNYAWKGITPRYSRPMCIDPRAPYGLTVASAPTAFSNHKDEGGARAMLFRSENGGTSWRSLCDAAHSPSAANIHGLCADPEHPGGVLIGTDTGELWRVSNDAQWILEGESMPAVLSVAKLA